MIPATSMRVRDDANPLRAQGALTRHPDGPVAARILGEAVAAVDPADAIGRLVSIDGPTLEIGPHAVPLGHEARIWCIAVGKAAVPMGQALERQLGDRLTGGLVVCKHEPATTVEPASRLVTILSSHPVPDARSEAAGAAVLDLLDRVGPDDVVLVLLSGGASSLMVAPAPGLTLEHVRRLGEALVRSGASIEEINAVRAPLDRLKGGGLARRVAPARVVTLVLDDVVGAPLYVVGSGPTMTMPRPTDGPSARAVLQRHRITVPEVILRRLEAQPPPTLTATGPVVRLAGNDTAVEASIGAARAEGWAVRRLPPLRGEARAFGRALAERITDASIRGPVAWVGGGESTVTVRGSGRGGRNQELALAAMPGLAGHPGCLLVTLATDGDDGPTDAAGAVVTGDSLARARALGLDVAQHLANNDAYPVFDALGDLLRIGPTGTNVCDLVLALVRP